MTGPQSVEPLGDTVGALARWRLADEDPSAAAAELRTLIDCHRVVVIRDGPPLADDALVLLMAQLGEILSANRTDGEDGRPAGVLTVLTDETSGRPTSESGWPAAGLPWHNDYSYLPEPGQESALGPIELPPCGGGSTSFVDMVAAAAALPADARARLEEATTRCELPAVFAGQWDREPGPVVAPVIAAHPRLGVPVLWLGPAWGSLELPDGTIVPRSEPVDHAIGTGRRYDHRWQPGDLVVWDNVAVMHARAPIDQQSRRAMRQVSTRLPQPLRRPG